MAPLQQRLLGDGKIQSICGCRTMARTCVTSFCVRWRARGAEPSLSRTHRGWVWRMASDLGASGVLQACTTPIVRRREKSRKREVKHRRDCASLALAILRRYASIAYISASYRLPHVFGSFPPSARPKGCPSVSPLRHRLLTGIRLNTGPGVPLGSFTCASPGTRLPNRVGPSKTPCIDRASEKEFTRFTLVKFGKCFHVYPQVQKD